MRTHYTKMSNVPPGEGNPVLLNPEDPSKEWAEGRNFAQIAEFLAHKLTPMEYYHLVLAIEDSDFHEAVLQQWKNMPHPEPIVGDQKMRNA